mgnify:CR=1 FL=1
MATFKVPVKFAALEIVCPLIRPEVTTPKLELVLKRLVEVAVVLKRFPKVPVLLNKLVVVA